VNLKVIGIKIPIIIPRMRLILLLSSVALLLAFLQACTTEAANNSQGSFLSSPHSSNTTFSGYVRTGVLFK
jgi:hypothetical protein